MCAERHRRRGFTLIEIIVAIALVSVGLAGVLSVFTSTVQKSADPVVRKQLLALAEEMMEEVQLKPYGAGPGAISGCNRASADDIWDYNNYTSTGSICDIDGVAIAALSGYSVQILVQTSTLVGVTEAAKITVTASRGGETLSLIGWRTNYGGDG